MRLTLDWDNESALDNHYHDVRDRPTFGSNPWQLRYSSGPDGFHYVEWDAVGTWADLVALREQHGDDPKRLRLDKKRHALGSPFLSVLYTTKYMDRWGWKPETGQSGSVADGHEVIPESERIKFDGRLDYRKIASLLVADEYGTQAALSDSLGAGASTISGWLRGESEPSQGNRKKLRRRARSHGLGHFRDDKSIEKMGLDVDYYDPDGEGFDGREQRRTIVEYCDTPWSEQGEQYDPEATRTAEDYAKLNVHTGSYNSAHSEKQLKAIHDKVVEHCLDALSPVAPEHLEGIGGTRMGGPDGLDRDTMHPVSREEDSVNYENELLDADEARYYRANMVGKTGAASKGVTPDTAASQPLFEVLLWDDTMTTVIWQVIGVWSGSTISDATIVADSLGWW